MSIFPPKPNPRIVRLEQALAASQRREQELKADLERALENGRTMVAAADRHFATALANHKECEQLRTRLDAAAELAEQWKQSSREAQGMMRGIFSEFSDLLCAALSPTDPPAGETK